MWTWIPLLIYIQRMTTDTERVAGEIRVILERRGWKRKDLADHSGIPESTLSRLLRRQDPQRMSVPQLLHIAAGLSMDPGEIVDAAIGVAPSESPTPRKSA